LHIYRVVFLLPRQSQGTAGNGLGTAISYLQRTTSDAARSGLGLGATINYLTYL